MFILMIYIDSGQSRQDGVKINSGLYLKFNITLNDISIATSVCCILEIFRSRYIISGIRNFE